MLRIDPEGGAIDVTLPAESDDLHTDGLILFIKNTADAAETITVKDDGAATVVTIAQNEGAIVHCNGTDWECFDKET
jgi:hypothetical protein